MEGKRYNKRKDCATMDGEWYEVLVTLLVFLRLKNNPAITTFRLATNVDGAGAFDDVVVTFRTADDATDTEWQTLFVQLKHKVKATLGLDQLFAGEKKGFSLPKYKKSYAEVKANITAVDVPGKDIFLSGPVEKSNFVLFTNASLHKTLAHKKTKVVETRSEADKKFDFVDLLKSGADKDVIFKFNPEEDKVVYDRLEGDGVFEFLEKLTVFCGQSRVGEIDKLIKTELISLYSSTGSEIDRVYEICKCHFQVWWRDSDIFLDENSSVLEQCVAQLAFEKNCFQHLDSYTLKDINFLREVLEKVHISLQDASLLHVLTNSKCLKITTTKIHRMFEMFPALAIYSTVEYFNDNKDLTNHWLNGTNDIIVLVSGSTVSQENVKSVVSKMKNILDEEKYKHKKMILISEENVSLHSNVLESQIPSYIRVKDHHYSFHDLDDQTQDYLRNILIPFQNYEVPLKSIFDDNIDVVNNFLSGNIGVGLVSGERNPVGQQLPPALPYYIPRSLRMRNVVATNLFFSLKAKGFFLVTGVTVDELESMLGGNRFVESEMSFPVEQDKTAKFYTLDPNNSTLQSSTKKPLFLILKHEDATVQFNLLCSSYKDVHWLNVEFQTKQLVWKRSQGVIHEIKAFAVNEESNYQQSCVIDSDSKFEIVIGEAGMGKTTLMGDLAREMKQSNPQDWVVLVCLRPNSDNLCEYPDAIEFLTVVGLNDEASKLEKSMFVTAVREVGNVIVLFDGLDEICPQYEEEVFELIDQILKTKVKKIVVSSRYSYQYMLELRHGTISKEIIGFTENDWEYLFNYFGLQVSKAPVHSKIVNDNSFLCIPLLAMMFAEIFKESGKISDESFENINLFNLVVLFVKRKFDIYFKKRRTELKRKDMERKFFKDHSLAALNVFLTEDDLRNIFSNKLEKFNENLESGGILHSVKNKKPIFIHQTFAEYFTALWALEHMDKSGTYLKKYLFTTNFDGVRYMFDNMLAQDSELHKAVLERNVLQVETLLSTQKCNTDSVDEQGRQAIHLAASLGFQRSVSPRPKHIVELLLEQEAAVDCKDCLFNWTPLQYAFETRSFDAADYLLANNNNTANCLIPQQLLNSETLCLLINNGFTNVLKLMLLHMKFDKSILLQASQYGNSKIVDMLLSIDKNTKVQDRWGNETTIMHVAAEFNHVSLFEKLYTSVKMHETKEAVEPYLHAACRGGSSRIVDYLISQGAELNQPDNTGRTALFTIQRQPKERLYLSELLMSIETDIIRQAEEGWPTLFVPLNERRLEVVKRLVALGADLDVLNNAGVSPFGAASQSSRVGAIALTILHGGDVNKQDNAGKTPLHVASREGHKDVIKLLVARGADVDARSASGWTPLHVAAAYGNPGVVGLLFSLGADVNCQDNAGDTPLHVASLGGEGPVREILVSRGARDESDDTSSW